MPDPEPLEPLPLEPLEPLDLGIESLTDSVGDPMIAIVQDPTQVVLQRARYHDYRLQPRMRGPKMPFPPETSGPTFPPVGPQVAQALFDRPSPARLQVQGFQTSEHLPVTLRQVLLREQPKILRAFKGVIAFRLQTAVFCLTHPIDRLGHVLHDVVAVVDDLGPRPRKILPGRSNKRVPHVHGHRLNARLLTHGEIFIVGVLARFLRSSAMNSTVPRSRSLTSVIYVWPLATAFSSVPRYRMIRRFLACRPRCTARSIMPQASSQLIRSKRVAPRTSASRSVSMACFSKAKLKRAPSRAQGTPTRRMP